LFESYIKNYIGKNSIKPLSIAIVGAGATGVELAAQLHEVTNVLAMYGLKETSDVKLTIIEAATQLLPALPIKLATATQQQLVSLGVDLRMGRRVTEITREGITTHDGEFIEADIKVWAAGIKAPDWLKELDGLETNHISQLVVDSTLKPVTMLFLLWVIVPPVSGKGMVAMYHQERNRHINKLQHWLNPLLIA